MICLVRQDFDNQSMHTLFKQNSEETFMEHEFLCVVISNICFFSLFIIIYYVILDDQRCMLHY